MHRYIDHVVCFNIKGSHHHLNEHTILRVFRAPGFDSLVPLNWYKQYPTSRTILILRKLDIGLRFLILYFSLKTFFKVVISYTYKQGLIKRKSSI